MDVFTLANARGMEVRFIAYGGTIVSIRVPDRDGAFADVTPGFDSPDDYAHDGFSAPSLGDMRTGLPARASRSTDVSTR
jgi:galactose mutarotase-like enzyme